MALPRLSRSKRPAGIVGLDIDTLFLAGVQASEGRVVNAASVELAPGLVRDGEVQEPGELGAALKAFFKESGLPGRVRIGVANQQILMRELELPRIEDREQLEAAVRFQAAEAIAMPLDEAVLDFQVVGESTNLEGQPRLRVIVVAARESMVNRVVEAARGAGLKPEGIDLNAFALVRALGDPADAGDSARVYCHIAGVSNLAVALGSTCLFTRTLVLPDEEQADHDAGELAEQIRLSIDAYMSRPDARWVGEVVLSGPGARRHDLAGELSELVGVSARVADPLPNLDLTGMPEGEDPHRHTVAAGLALGAAA